MQLFKTIGRVTDSASNSLTTGFTAVEHTLGTMSETMFSTRIENLHEIKENLQKYDIFDDIEKLSLEELSMKISSWGHGKPAKEA